MRIAWPSEATATIPSGGGGATDTIIEVHDLVKTYRSGGVQVPALRGVSLRVRRGEMLAILGASGSGKSTLIKCVNGLEPFQQGEIRVVAAHLDAGALHRVELVLEDRLGVVEQPTDQRGLAVVHGAGRREAQYLGHQK